MKVEKVYPSNLSGAQRRAIEPFVGQPDPRGNPGKYERRAVARRGNHGGRSQVGPKDETRLCAEAGGPH